MLIGPYVTKLTLGVLEDDEAEFPRPTATVVMPTVHLMRMVADLHEIFTSKEFKEDSKKMLLTDIKNYFGPKGLLLESSEKGLVKKLAKDV